MKTHPTLNILQLLVCLGLVGASHAQTATTPQHSRQIGSAWLSEQWTANDVQWRRLRVATEKEIATSNDKGKLLQRLGATAQANPKQADVQYSWAYAVFLATVAGFAPAQRLVPVVARAVANVPSPQAYEFARARFLLESKQFPAPRLLEVGRRLAKRDPNDYSVKYRLVKILDPGLSSQQKQEALIYARDLVRLEPKRPSAHASLASVFFRSWLLSKSQQDKAQALGSYRTYLQLAPKNDSFRPQAHRIIAQLEKA